MNHLLTNDELQQLQQIKQRRHVSTADAVVLESIYKRLEPKYEICPTCLETIASEARSLIAYAEKQIGGSLNEWTAIEEEVPQIEDSEKIVVAKIDKTKVGQDNLVVADQSKKVVEVVPAFEPAVSTGGVWTWREIWNEMTNEEIVAFVASKTEVELSVDADREELIDSAIELLRDFGFDGPEPTISNRVELSKNGLPATKSETIRAFVKQEKGVELSEDLSRQDLIRTANEILKS